MARIELINICKTLKPGDLYPNQARKKEDPYDPKSAPALKQFKVSGINLSIPDGTILAVIGPSGCGKSTLLKLISGLETPDSGSILMDGEDMLNVPAEERGIGMVFQGYALYPHLDSKSNIVTRYLFNRKTPDMKKEEEEKYRMTAELLGVDMEYLLNRKPSGLSGGEKQRVALGRCITRNPRLFLLDEPFSDLDAVTREKYRSQLKQLLKQFRITTVYVTHDQIEALILADTVAVMDSGRVVQTGTYREIYDDPANLFVAGFLNNNNEAPAINLLDGLAYSPEYDGGIIGARCEDTIVSDSQRDGFLKAELVRTMFSPGRRRSLCMLNASGTDVFGYVPAGEDWKDKKEAWFRFDRFFIFDKKSGLRTGAK